MFNAPPSSHDPLDLALADLALRRDGTPNAPLIALSVALLSRARRDGNTCLDLTRAPEFVGNDEIQGLDGLPFVNAFPPAHEWLDALAKSPLVGDGALSSMLVLEPPGSLFFYRDWCAEQELTEFISAAVHDTLPDLDQLDPKAFRALFPCSANDTPDWQAVAAMAALRSRFALITGGPGTGKTTTVTRILALILSVNPELQVALCAPTGKAAQRMTESVAKHLSLLPAHLQPQRSFSARTVHRLLRYFPGDDHFRHHRMNPLTHDLVIVDEASMVDISLMHALIMALKPGSRLILLGDHQQLASVESGSILQDIGRAVSLDQGYSAPFCQTFQSMAGSTLSKAESDPGALRDAVVMLLKNHRFGEGNGIAALSDAIRTGDAEAALNMLETARYEEISWHRHIDVEALLESLHPHVQQVITAQSAKEALERFHTCRVLTGLRRGPMGCETINDRLDRELRAASEKSMGPYYSGQPILITENDYQVKLYNGDIGMVWSSDQGLRVAFPDTQDGMLCVSPARLPAHQTAWAMTIHKAQGSEFGHVMIVLPPTGHALSMRPLIYTAVTRAQRHVTLWGSADQIQSAIQTPAHRHSGLTQRLLSTEHKRFPLA